MKKTKYFHIAFLAIIIISIISCESKISTEKIEEYKKEIIDTEKAFVASALNEGIAVAFTKFAADDTVLMRNDSLIKSKLGIKKFYSMKNLDNSQLTWSADFVDVSSSGDLGYTYGNYIYLVTDSTGKTTNYEGVFHTVWKRQKDGSWKYVWD